MSKTSKQQERINKLGGKFEDQITRMILAHKPTEEILVAAISALSTTIVAIAVSRFGSEKAPEMISEAINAALKREKLPRRKK